MSGLALDNAHARLNIRLPEGVSFALPLAGPMLRFLSWAVDFGAIAVATFVLSAFLPLLEVITLGLAQALATIFYFLLTMGYGIALEWLWRGQTIGKRIVGLRVMDEQGLNLSFSQVVLRNLLRVVDMLPALYLVGGAACFLSPRRQRLGDLAANTVVVREPRRQLAIPSQLLGGKYNSFRDHPHIEARLRQAVTPAEAAIALQALVRREELEPAARVELYTALADHFRAVAKFPEEATRGLTDEQYLRNTVDTLFNLRHALGR